MANHRISIEKRALIISILAEGTPIRAVCRAFKVGQNTVARIIAETGEAMAHYMSENFRDVPCSRVELDEAHSYVFKHGHEGKRTVVHEEGKGDYWLWCAVDADTKLVISHHIGRRDGRAANAFIEDVTTRVKGPTQFSSDALFMYRNPMARNARRVAGDCYGIETKHFLDPATPEKAIRTRRNRPGLIVKCTRETVFGNTHLGLLTTAHIERVFLSVRQELVRFTRLTLAYSKSLDMHKAATALYFGLYNLCRRHKGIDGQTPAQAAGVEENRWTLEQVVAYADTYWQPRHAAQAALNSADRRAKEDAMFEAAINSIE